MMIEIGFRCREGAVPPAYETSGSAGLDIRACLEEEIVLGAGSIVCVPTGIFMEIPDGYEVQVRPRSGLALKNGVTVLNSPGTIDSDYRGEVKVILINLSDKPFVIRNGDRIAQIVPSAVTKCSFKEKDELGRTGRMSGGFGSTGV